MAVSLQHGNLRRKPGRGHRPMAEINVTPFVDVMLVLLVVFMITAPLLTVGVPVDLPKAATSTLAGAEEPLTITVRKDGGIYLQETRVELDELAPRLAAIAQAKGQQSPRVFVRGDAGLAYGSIMEVMGTINAGGFNRVALVASAPQGAADAKAKR
jgi:biopolymer transport protein TolR